MKFWRWTWNPKKWTYDRFLVRRAILVAMIAFAILNLPYSPRGEFVFSNGTALFPIVVRVNSTSPVVAAGSMTFTSIGGLSADHPVSMTATLTLNPRYADSSKVSEIILLPQGSIAYNKGNLSFPLSWFSEMFHRVNRFWINSTGQYEAGNITLTNAGGETWSNTHGTEVEWFDSGNWNCTVVFLDSSNNAVLNAQIGNGILQVGGTDQTFNFANDSIIISLEVIVAALIIFEIPLRPRDESKKGLGG